MKLNYGLLALTTREEFLEIKAIGQDVKRRKLKFAFWQSDFKGGRFPMWHMDYLNESDFGTTLSQEGWKDVLTKGDNFNDK